MKKKLKIHPFLKTRLCMLLSCIVVLFALIILRFFELQILGQEQYVEGIEHSTQKIVEEKSLRGEIYDRYGRPLVVNKPVYTLKIDQQMKLSKKDLNDLLLKTILLLEQNGDTYIDEIPISKEPPFVFTASEGKRKLFIQSIPYNGTQQQAELMSYSAQELVDYLRSDAVFQLDDGYTAVEARKIMAARHQMYQMTYQKYAAVTLATTISAETMAVLAEQTAAYPALFYETDAIRYYPYGKVLGNVLGYTRKITATQYEDLAASGYTKNDRIGQMGMEQSMEENLRGKDGRRLIAVDNMGRSVKTLFTEPAIAGNDVFLTIDASLQSAAYEAIEKRLAEAIVVRLRGGKGVKSLAPREILISMVESNQLSFEKMKAAPQGTIQHTIYHRILEEYTDKEDGSFKQFFLSLLQRDPIYVTDRELLLAFYEQGAILLPENTVTRLYQGNHAKTGEILIEALLTGGLKPDQMAIDPYSAAAVILDVHTGEVLALVGYPSYDSNALTTDFNQYYSALQDGIDKRNLLWNNALMTAKAPGSTFKMISALVGLEEGIINRNTTVQDTGAYTKAGHPHPKCWFYTNNGYGHGTVDVLRGLEVSCNYYFYDLAYRLGVQNGGPYGAIDKFTTYATMFGLNQKTGIELPETMPNISNPQNLLQGKIASALNAIYKATEKGQVVYDELMIPVLEHYGYDMDGDLFEKISKQLIKDFQVALARGVVSESSLLTNTILQDTTSTSTKAKTKAVVSAYLMTLVSPSTYNLFVKVADFIEPKELMKKVIDKLVSYLLDDEYLEWSHAINVRTAIGQGNNAFTPLQIGRYIAALANGDKVHELKLVNGINNKKEAGGYQPQPEKILHPLTIQKSSLDIVKEGMYRVVNGREGSARTAFLDATVKVAGKTGTAQEATTEHSWFAGFAPYDNPQVAIVTTMYGAYGLGKNNYLLAKDLFELAVGEKEDTTAVTMGPQWVD